MAESEPTPATQQSPQAGPTPEPEQSTEELVQAIYHFAAEQLHNGVAPHNVEKLLIEKGLDAEAAGTVVENLRKARSEALREAGKKNMLYGALWCVGGIVVTVVTYQAAAGGGGGSYVVAWGAILFGAIQFFRGAFQNAGE